MREHKGKSLVDYINDYTVIDIETTGLSPVYDEIIELAAIRVRDGIIADTFSALVRPICQLDSFIVQLTGITNDMLKTAPRIHKVLLKYIEFLGDDILVGHNIHFDINFIYDNCISELGQPLPNDFIDILRVSRILLKSLENHKLNTIAQELSIDCSQAHRALGDCIITYKCYELLKNIMREGDYYRRLALQIIESLNDKGIYHDVLGRFAGAKTSIEGPFMNFNTETIYQIFDLMKLETTSSIYNCDYLITSNSRAREFLGINHLNVINESNFCELFRIPIRKKQRRYSKYIKVSEIIADSESMKDEAHPFYNKTCVITGALEKITRQDAMQIIENIGGICASSISKKTDYLIIGNCDYFNSKSPDGKTNKRRKAEEYILQGCNISIISENEFYDLVNL